jgi:hypothetical protein
MLNLKRNTCLNSLMILMIGNKYYGALHLMFYLSYVYLQISRGSAAKQVQRTVNNYSNAPTF